MKSLFGVVVLGVIFGVCSNAAVGKEQLLAQANKLKTEATDADKYFNNHMFSSSHLLDNLHKLTTLIHEIEAANSNVDKLSTQLDALKVSIKTEVEHGNSLIKQRDQLHNRANDILEKAQKADAVFKAHHQVKESNAIQLNISFVYSLLYQIVNLRSSQELVQVKPQFEEVYDKLVKQIELSQKLHI